MCRPLIVLCLVLCLIAHWLMRTALDSKETEKPSSTPQVAAKSSMSVSAPTPLKAEEAPTARKPRKIASKGKVRLKPGESAVLGYWEIAAGMNGMAIVTPETTAAGQVKMTVELLHMPDAAVADADAHDLFPDLFDFENHSVIGPERLRELQSSLQTMRGIDMLTTPTVLTRPGQQASISIGNPNEAMLSLGLRADPVAEEGSYDLRLELQRQE